MAKVNISNLTFQKPDSIDTPISTDTPTSITTTSPIIYEKPNAYDEKPPVVITASRHGSRSSRVTVDSFSSRYFQRNNPAVRCHSTSSSSTLIDSNTPPLSPLNKTTTIRKSSFDSRIDKHITHFILSQSTPTTQTTFAGHQDDTPFHHQRPSSPTNSIQDDDEKQKKTKQYNHGKNATDIVAAVAALLSNDSGIVSSFFLQNNPHRGKHKLKIPNKKTKSHNMIVYNFRKASLLKPNQHHIYLHIDHPEDDEDEDVMAYRKIQPFSAWGIQSMLLCNRNDGQGIKVAEARRRAFQRDITIESADYENSLVEDITQPYLDMSKLRAPATNNIFCQDLVKCSQSNILFEYESWFHGSRMRWTRPSLLSHDFTCEIKLTKPEKKLQSHTERNSTAKKKNSLRYKVETVQENGFIDSDSDDDEDDHDHHTHRTCRRWKLIAQFHSRNLNFLNQNLGQLSIDLDILNQVEKDRCDLLEANLVMTCSTLIDIIREIMGK